MQIKVNGADITVPEGSTLEDLAKQLSLIPETIICEHNGTLHRQEVFHTTTLHTGDTVEWLHFMGGGEEGRSAPAKKFSPTPVWEALPDRGAGAFSHCKKKFLPHRWEAVTNRPMACHWTKDGGLL